MNKPLVIYHDTCADGFGAAFAAWTILGDSADYLPLQYGSDVEKWDHTCCYGRRVYILDFSLPKAMMTDVFNHAEFVVWLDHHKTAFEMWEVPTNQRVWVESEGCYVKLHMDKSGAYLAWEYFHPLEEVPRFIQLIDDYDRWVFKFEDTKAFNKAIRSYMPWDFEQWNAFFIYRADNDIFFDKLITEGSAILKAHDQNVKATVKGGARSCNIFVPNGIHQPQYEGMPTYLHNFIGLAANCLPHLTSDVGHELANQSGTFGLLWYLDKDNVCKCSLRSKGDYDVSAIAKAFGGGGHLNAAGMSVPIDILLSWIK